MATGKLTVLSKIIITAVVVGVIFLGIKLIGGTGLMKKLAPGADTKDEASALSDEERANTIRVAVVTWGGYAGGQYFNEGFKASKESRYFKEYGINVEFKLMDDFNASREAWKSDNVDLLWTTIDAFPTEAEGLREFKPRVVFQSDWSRGGDAIVVRRGIEKVGDLKAKAGEKKMKIAVAPMTPSHTFLLSLFKAGEVNINDVQIVEVANAIDAADVFKKGQVDAAVVWSPDDQDCIAKVPGSKILLSTKTATNIIADVFIAKESYIEKNRETVIKLVTGWLRGSAEINASEDAKRKAAKILADGLQQPEDFCYNAINNARLCTYGDNVNFFNLNGDYRGVTGEDLYSKMSIEYAKVGYVKMNKAGLPEVTPFRTIADPSIIRSITSLSGNEHAAETSAKFTPATAQDRTAAAVSTKKVSIAFPTGKFELDENAKYIIDKEFVDIAKGFSSARIRIEGNTDNVGNAKANKDLSLKRAQAVADYLMSAHNFDTNRFIVTGNGSDKPVADNSSSEGKAKNRRTDFELIPQ
jgi:NitT/TauT family transport system substrate-binding protein